MNPLLLKIAIDEGPAVIGLLKLAFGRAHPGQPEPTSEEVIAAYESAFASSIARDEAWLAAHPTD